MAAVLPFNITAQSAPTAAPYTGTPIAIPGRFEAESFDLGGEGVAYHDIVPGNAGGQFRPGEDVDIIVSSDSLGGGYVVTHFENGEWLAYTVNVATSAQYDIELRVTSALSNSAFHIEIDGLNATGSVVVPNTGSWSTFRWIGKRGVALTAGTHVLKIVADKKYFDLNSIRVTATTTPYSGVPIAIPGTFEAENFNLGGEGVAYHDTVPGNSGGEYRLDEDVDIIASSDVPGGDYVVNNFAAGEWLAYTINVTASTQYDIELRVSSAFANSAFHVEVDGRDVSGTIAVPSTGSWNAFQWVGKKGVALTAGQHVLKIVADQAYFNLNSIRLTASSDTQAPTIPANLAATVVSSSRIDLSWSAATDNVGVNGYYVYRDGVQVGNVSGTSYSDAGLSAGTTYSYAIAAYDATGNVSAQGSAVSATTRAQLAPYSGAPVAIPGTFEAENFALGGEGVAYHDNGPGNAGGQYRLSEDVDISVSTDSLGGGYVVDNFETGEWLAYAINVASSGQYDIEIRASSMLSTSAFHIEIDGVDVTGSVPMPNTGHWNTFQWIGRRGVALTAGTHVLKIVADQQYFNLNSIRVTAGPTSGVPIAIPGTFEAENFALGGEGVAYHDNTPGNAGGQYRLSEDVDIAMSDEGLAVNNFETGEWLAYVINVASSGQYDIEIRASSMLSTSAFHIEIDGVDVTGSVPMPNTGHWNLFQWIGRSGVPLTAGTHVLKIVADQQYFNLNSIRVTATSAPGSAKLLFSSGFEGTTALAAPSAFYGNGGWQGLIGVDGLTGFAWPPNLWGGSTSTQLMLIADAPADATTIGNYMVNQIQTVTGRNGNPTRALYSEIKQSGCCGTNPMGSGFTQDTFMIQPPGETGDLYVSYWLKFQPDLAQKMTHPNWRVVFEWKTAGDYRVIASVVTWGGPPLSWHIVGDNNANGGLPYQSFWEAYSSAPVPIGEWFKFEVFWHRSSGNDGRVWMAVNGQVIVDRYGPNKGINNAPIDRVMVTNLYSSTSYPIYQWVDNVEIWDGFPPVGNNPPYAPQ